MIDGASGAAGGVPVTERAGSPHAIASAQAPIHIQCGPTVAGGDASRSVLQVSVIFPSIPCESRVRRLALDALHGTLVHGPPHLDLQISRPHLSEGLLPQRRPVRNDSVTEPARLL